MTLQSVLEYAGPLAIAIVGTFVLLWLFQLGRVRPGLAYYSPVMTVFSALLALAFLVFAVANAVYGVLPSPWAHALFFGCGIMFVCGAIDAATYRLTWDDDGFRVRRLIGKSFAATWSQVTSAQALTNNEYRIELIHPHKKAFHVSTFLVGSHEFISTLNRCVVRLA